MIRLHGGGCCGIRHSSGYSAQEETAVRTLFQDIGQCPQGCMLEVVLTDGQLRGNRLSRMLVTSGFKLVYRFRNANSGNICNVFHRHNAPLPLKDLPFSLEPFTPEENPYRQDDLSLPVGWCRFIHLARCTTVESFIIMARGLRVLAAATSQVFRSIGRRF